MCPDNLSTRVDQGATEVAFGGETLQRFVVGKLFAGILRNVHYLTGHYLFTRATLCAEIKVISDAGSIPEGESPRHL